MDNTIFPLFLDSLITGKWDDQLHIFDESIWNHLTTLRPVIDSINVIPIDQSIENSKALEVQFFRNDTMQFFIGRLIEGLAFPATDSIEYQTGYFIREFPETEESIIIMNTTRMKWVTTEEPRNITPLLTLQGSPIHSIIDNDTTFVPFTIQTTNSIDVQALLTFTLDTGGLNRQKE